jgi:hypothetical protein
VAFQLLHQLGVLDVPEIYAIVLGAARNKSEKARANEEKQSATQQGELT